MKKYIVLITILTLFAGSLPLPTHAQSRPKRTPNPDAYQEYVYDLKTYFTARQTYDKARSQYKAYGTAQTKEDFLDASKAMLESSRVAMMQYITILLSYMDEQDMLNQRISETLHTDLQTHQDYLRNQEQTIKDIQTLDQAVISGDALTQRYGYLKVTATQTLNYIDAIEVKHRIDDTKEIVSHIQDIITGFPETNRNKQIAQKWVEEMLPDIATNEQSIVQYIEDLYPSREDPSGKRFYEINKQISTAILDRVKTKQKNYVPKMKDIDTVVKEAYQEL